VTGGLVTSRPGESEPFAVRFFDEQFRRQVASRDFELNPFERIALEHVRGSVLDLGCGLGNLALAAARRGCSVTAVDGSRAAVRRIRRDARAEGLRVRVVAADVERFEIEERYDSVVSIGLLMCFRRETALSLVAAIRDAVAPEGLAVVNALIEGTTYTAMLDPACSTLFREDELAAAFARWDLLVSRVDSFAAPGGGVKRFSTVVARRPR
jgi:tellurite methyltransferase